MSDHGLQFVEGWLVPGTHVLSRDVFLKAFCSETERSIGRYQEASRSDFYKPFIDIHEWAQEAGATSIVIGGSFVSRKECPTDMDILIFFASSDQIPKSSECYDVNGVMLDIQLLSEDRPSIADAYLELLGAARNKARHGLIQIKFHSTVQTFHIPNQSSPDLEIVKTAYLGRRWSRQQKTKGVVVPIHGIRTNAESWLPHLCLTASNSGWAVAPYVYGYRKARILGDGREKYEVVEGFRNWLIEVRRQYSGPISVIAHSFGTYIIGRYLMEAKDISEKFDAIILCGSILNTGYDWTNPLEEALVGRVLNTISVEDEWVKFLPDGGVRFFANDELLGKAGCVGFSTTHPRFHQIESSLLKHNNVFKDDVIVGEWLPFLEFSKGSQQRREMEMFVDAFKKGG